MANNNDSSRPADDSWALTEIDFDSFLSEETPSEIKDEKVSKDIAQAEKSIEDDIASLYNDVVGTAPSQAEPSAPVQIPPQEAFFTPEPAPEPAKPAVSAPTSEDFSDVLSDALGELDGLLDSLYTGGVESKPKAEPAPAPSAPQEDELEESGFSGLSPDALNAITPPAVPGKLPEPASRQVPDVSFVSLPDNDVPAAPARPSQAKPAEHVDTAKQKPADEKKDKRGFIASTFPVKGDSTGEVIRKIVLMVSVLTIIVSAGILVNSYVIEPHRFSTQAEKAAGDLLAVDNQGNISDSDLSDIAAQNPAVKYPDGLLPKYKKLYAANQDLAGWITIPAFEMNFPLAQGSDNSYYLKRDIYAKRTKYGVPFFDYRNHLSTLDKNTVIYGHNMEYDDLIFGMLESYRKIEGFRSAPVIECNTIFADYKWKVYAVFITNGVAAGDNGYVFNYNFTQLDEYTFSEYIAQVDQRKLYTTGVDILSTDKILTLSTCCYDFKEARLVVIARLVRPGESPDVQTSNAVANPNPRYPQAWYDAQGKSNPYAGAEKWVAYADLVKNN